MELVQLATHQKWFSLTARDMAERQCIALKDSRSCLKKNLNASRPSEHPPARGQNVKTFGWDHSLQRPKKKLLLILPKMRRGTSVWLGFEMTPSTDRDRPVLHYSRPYYIVHSLNRTNCNISLSVFAPENLVSRDGFAVPSRVSLLISILGLNMIFTYGIPPKFRDGVHLFILNRHTPSGQSRVYRVTHLRSDGVHCRESAGTGSVNLKVLPNECCLGRSPWTN